MRKRPRPVARQAERRLDVRWVDDDRYRLAFEVAPVGLLIEDPDGRCVELNPHLRRLLGVVDGTPRSLDEFTEPEDARRLAAKLAELRAGAIAGFEIELRVTARDGVRRVLHKVASRLPGDDGRVVCVITDVTDQKRRQAELQRRTLQLQDGEQIAAIGTYELDLATGALTFSDGAYRLFGLEPRAIVPTVAWVRAQVAADDRAAFDAELANLQAGARTIDTERRMRRVDGEERVWRIRGRLRAVGDGALRVVGVIQDVTDQRAAARIKDEVVAVVSHELRTPLTLILAPLAMLERGQLDPRSDAGRELIRYALDAARHMTRLVTDIFDLGRLQTGHLTIRPRTFDLAAFLRHEIEARREAEGAAPRAAFAVDVPDRLEAWADPDRVQQVLTNLLDNAVGFSPPGGLVRVTATAGADEVRVEVIDQGPGVPCEHRETVFERFRQLDPARTRVRGGTGLGLTICKHLVERQGGRIWIEGAEGGGALVAFTLPARAL